MISLAKYVFFRVYLSRKSSVLSLLSSAFILQQLLPLEICLPHPGNESPASQVIDWQEIWLDIIIKYLHSKIISFKKNQIEHICFFPTSGQSWHIINCDVKIIWIDCMWRLMLTLCPKQKRDCFLSGSAYWRNFGEKICKLFFIRFRSRAQYVVHLKKTNDKIDDLSKLV